MDKQKQERLFVYMNELHDMLVDIEREVRNAGLYSLEYEIQTLQNLICSVRNNYTYYLENGIEE